MKFLRILVATLASFLFVFPAAAEMTCRLNYDLKGWSLFYKEYKGGGVVACRNGQRAHVSIVARGGGLTIGKSEIDNGSGVFFGLKSIGEIFGTYVSVDGHAGATKSVEAWAMSKGEVSLALSGKGRGVDLGFSIGGFTIKRK